MLEEKIDLSETQKELLLGEMDTEDISPLDFEEELKVVNFLRHSTIGDRLKPKLSDAFESLQSVIDETFGIQRTIFTHCDLSDYRTFVDALPPLCTGIRGISAAGAEITVFFTGDFTDTVSPRFTDTEFWNATFDSLAKSLGFGSETRFRVSTFGKKASELPSMNDGSLVFGKYLIAVGEESWMYLVVSQHWIQAGKQPVQAFPRDGLSFQDWIDGLEAWGSRYVYAGKSLGRDFWSHPIGASLSVVIGGTFLSIHTAEHIKNGTRIPVSALHVNPSVVVHADSGEIVAECEVLCAGSAWSMRVLRMGVPEYRYLDPPEGMIGMMVSVGPVSIKTFAKQGSVFPLAEGYKPEAIFSNGLSLPGRFISDGEKGWFEVSLAK